MFIGGRTDLFGEIFLIPDKICAKTPETKALIPIYDEKECKKSGKSLCAMGLVQFFCILL